MTLQQLEYILAVNRFRHFGHAAEYCGVTQPTLSAMVQKLENELEITIFDRRSSPIQPTPIGKMVLEQAQHTYDSARRLRDLVSEQKNALSAPFTLGVLPTIAPYLIPRFFPQLANRHPETDIRIVEMNTEQIRQALGHNEIDAGIVAELEGMDEFQVENLFYEELFVYVSPNCRLAQLERIKKTDLQKERLWLLGEGHCLSRQMQYYCHLANATHSKQAYRLGSIETFMRMVEAGRGATFIPALALDQLGPEQRKLVKPFALPTPTRHIVMLTQRGFVRDTLRRLILDSLRDATPSDWTTPRPYQQLV